MPIEIKELIIRTVIAPPADDDAGTGAAGVPSSVEATDHLVQACVREVLRILANDRER